MEKCEMGIVSTMVDEFTSVSDESLFLRIYERFRCSLGHTGHLPLLFFMSVLHT